jgi:hypothetical protein
MPPPPPVINATSLMPFSSINRKIKHVVLPPLSLRLPIDVDLSVDYGASNLGQMAVL